VARTKEGFRAVRLLIVQSPIARSVPRQCSPTASARQGMYTVPAYHLLLLRHATST
jgi:hypothetical protein